MKIFASGFSEKLVYVCACVCENFEEKKWIESFKRKGLLISLGHVVGRALYWENFKDFSLIICFLLFVLGSNFMLLNCKLSLSTLFFLFDKLLPIKKIRLGK